MARALLLALLAGGASVAAFAPFEFYPLALLSLAVLVALLERVPGPRAGFALGFAWGFGAFVGGVSWLYVSLNRYGGVPMPLAALAIGLFCAYLALYPALVGLAYRRLRGGGAVASAFTFGALWVLGEWLRGVMLTGFPWLAIGYSQTPPSPLAGFLPVLGVYGVGGIVAVLAALLVLPRWTARFPVVPALLVVAALGGGGLLGRIAWTAPVGEPLSVALVQTNVEQGLKWSPEHFMSVLQTNARLVRDTAADLVVLPESTLPALAEHLPDGYLDLLDAFARDNGAALVFGVFHRDDAGHIYNGALSLGSAPGQRYAKQHLVPFGEYSPPLFGWFYAIADMPMSDQTRGAPDQPPMRFGDQRVALNICYEDLFGAELLRSLPEATVLLNISNLAWFGDSLALPQHLQIGRIRAIETGRPMLRSTNTGMTAVVQPDGTVSAVLPQFEEGVLRAEVRGYAGTTPYVRTGNLPVLLAALAVVVAAALGAALGARGRRQPA